MKLVEFIGLDSILVDVDVDSKKNLFKLVSNFFAKNDLEESAKIIEKLNEYYLYNLNQKSLINSLEGKLINE